MIMHPFHMICMTEVSNLLICVGCYEPIRQLLTKSNGRPSDTNPLMKYLAALITGNNYYLSYSIEVIS
jgi:hypothetical protein